MNDMANFDVRTETTLGRADLYRFPWSVSDNPIGWVEVTDSCNISCHGCYRLRLDGHKDLDAIKEEIRLLSRIRNIHNLTLAGGEPLVHPHIVEIVRYGTELGLVPCLVSNGQALDEPMLVQLKAAGLAEISFHIDSGQTRKGWKAKTERELNALRQHRADLMASQGMRANFNMTVSHKNVNEVPVVLAWALANTDKVTGMTFITLRGAQKDDFDYLANGERVTIRSNRDGVVQDVSADNLQLFSRDLYRLIKLHHPAYQPSAYLGGTVSQDSLKWLVAQTITHDGEIIGSIGPRTMELAQTWHHMRHGRYTAGGRGAPFGREVFTMLPIDPGVRRALRRWARRPLKLHKPIRGFSIAIVQPPDIRDDGSIDMCDACPDLTLFEGKLVNSCRLEEYRKYGTLLQGEKRSTPEA